MVISTPKRTPQVSTSPSRWGGYYAGYSPKFVNEALTLLGLKARSVVVDPWNGSGITTAIAQQRSMAGRGFDLNPAIVIVAKARLLSSDITPSQYSLATAILNGVDEDADPLDDEPLLTWFCPKEAQALRQIERSTYRLLVKEDDKTLLADATTFRGVSHLAARFYVALFRTVRHFLTSFQTTNPTWIKGPALPQNRLRPSLETIKQVFRTEVKEIFRGVVESESKGPKTHAEIGDSSSIAINDSSADAVLTSPPYCTRIDYAVATKPELAVLGLSAERFWALRKKLLGTPLTDAAQITPPLEWGTTCRKLLRQIKAHPSKASPAYYYRNHIQYFASLYKSYGELARVLKDSSGAILVLQDSYYKDVHNDLQRITIEMMETHDLTLAERFDHHMTKTKASLNADSRKYRATFNATESVLVFAKG